MKSILYFFFCAAFGLTTAWSQSASMQITASTIPGITLTGPSGAGFQALASQSVPQNVFQRLQPILNQTVAVTNTTHTPLLAFTVRFERWAAQTQQPPYTHTIVQSLTKAVLQPSATYLISYDDAAFNNAVNGSPLPPHYVPMSQQSSLIAASLDSVIFADGTFAGPDVSSSFARYSNELQADRDLYAGIISHSNDESYVKSTLHDLAAQKITLGASGGNFYAARTSLRAGALYRYYQARGLPVLLTECEEALAGLGSMSIHR